LLSTQHETLYDIQKQIKWGYKNLICIN